jgi:hypothetical protein
VWDRKPLNLEFDLFPNERSPFLLGSIALAKKFRRKSFIDEEAKSYLYDLFKGGIPVYGGVTSNPAYSYYRRGILERNPKSHKKKSCWVNQYRVIMSRIGIIEQELKKTEYVNYLSYL